MYRPYDRLRLGYTSDCLLPPSTSSIDTLRSCCKCRVVALESCIPLMTSTRASRLSGQSGEEALGSTLSGSYFSARASVAGLTRTCSSIAHSSAFQYIRN